MTLDQIRARLAKVKDGNPLRAVAAAAGVPYGTVREIRRGTTTNPRLETFEKLRRYFRKSH